MARRWHGGRASPTDRSTAADAGPENYPQPARQAVTGSCVVDRLALTSRNLLFFWKEGSSFKIIAAGVARPDISHLSLAYIF